ncbi:MAG TPA: JAB domain-containing protein [Candidatus Omnitrophica bacterium]|nr:JAB domain-containing protein [Candidatus Omnitrophota bacterium]
MKKSKKSKLYPLSGIKSWPKDERPREKLLREGEHKLSNTELLAILLRTGTKGKSAVDLARRIIQKFKTFRNMAHTDLSAWGEFKGLGKAKISQIKAAIEIGRRFREEEIRESRPKVRSSKDVAEILMPRMRDLKREVFKILLLNSQNRVIDIVEVEEGTVNEANPILREIFQRALQNFAPSVICIHNHPSGNPNPSEEDKNFTRQLIQAGEILRIRPLDHVIIGDNCYFSFADEGLMQR